MFKLFIRVKFRALGVTFRTVERTIDVPIRLIVNVIGRLVPQIYDVIPETYLNNKLLSFQPDTTITIFDDRGVLVQLPGED